MFVSAVQGTLSLFRQENRSAFIDYLDKGTIQESVLGQATAGPMMMLSLFNDLQNPLFKRNNFDAIDFLEGVAPALERFHNVSGALENDLRRIRDEAAEKSEEEEEVKNKSFTSSDGQNKLEEDGTGAISTEERASMLKTFPTAHSNDMMLISEYEGKQANAILKYEWTDEAKRDPDSLAGQLAKMVTSELFHIHQISAKTACLLQNHQRSNRFKEGSCTVNNVALLSARTCMFVEHGAENQDDKNDDEKTIARYEPIDYEPDNEDDETLSNTAVAAQVEVLYDVSQDFIVDGATPTPPSSNTEDTAELKGNDEVFKQTTFVGVATLEGWLRGGPDGELRWRLALHRPAYEFPGIEQAY